MKKIKVMKKNKITMKVITEALGEFNQNIRIDRNILNAKVSKNPDGTIAVWSGAFQNIKDIKKQLNNQNILTIIKNFKEHGGLCDSTILVVQGWKN